ESPAPKQSGKYADQTMEMTGHGRGVDAHYPVKIYEGAELEARRVVSGPNGELIYAESRLPVRDGEYIYVMDKHGNIFIDKPQFGEVHHSSLAGGGKPAAGGQMNVAHGKPVKLDEITGHYGDNQPRGRSEVVKQELSDQGVDVSKARTEHYKNRK